MTERQTPPFVQIIELATKVAAGHMHLLADVMGMARNFQRTSSLPSSSQVGSSEVGSSQVGSGQVGSSEVGSAGPVSDQAGAVVASAQERHVVVEIERDGRVGIDLQFGTIVFKQAPDGAYAQALVDVIVAGDHKGGTRVQMELKVPASPDSDSIMAVTEKCRLQIVANLRAAADRFDATTASALVFQEKA